ncbi:alpha/beta fold hydrolase [Leptolyngbya sp. FACHB-261]|uniref:alpha/beta fold hydrolase n=1 Tax=Leptolyngbya sp. FACHB-261 TaxID=2692806 RepID=UPI0016846CA2|nr:alpha/beta hydrolase [Leptolyngbya sp. FACHB-261]MBD2104429.1 alpha/beta hydrolase [Leptolyngbya sp. FACHB-261]
MTSVPLPLHAHTAGQGFPILCLHGHPGNGRSMSVFTEHLSRRFWTLAPDLRGYGRSRTEDAFSMTDHLPDLEHLLDRHQIQRCLVLGWSLGGILAMELALRLGDRVSGLILVATAARPRGNHPPVSWQDEAFTGVASILNRIYPAWDWNIETFGKRSLYRYLIQQHNAHAYRRLAFEALEAYLTTSRPAIAALSQALQQRYSRLDDLPSLRVPALVLAGAEDRHITAASSEETAQALPNAEWHCYPNVAHLFPWEIPEQVLRDIDDWLVRHPQVSQASIMGME